MFRRNKTYYLGSIWINPDYFESNEGWLAKIFGNENELIELKSEIAELISLIKVNERERITRNDRVIDFAIVSGSPGWFDDISLGFLYMILYSRPKVTIEARVCEFDTGNTIKEYEVKSVMPWRIWIKRSFSIWSMLSSSNKMRLYEYKLVLSLGLISLVRKIKKENL